MFQILLKIAQELKRTDINLFHNTIKSAQKHPCISIRKLDMNFADFRTVHMILLEKE